MLDFSWSEFLVVLVVAVLAIGPRQLPEVLYTFGRLVRRIQYMKFAFSRQFDEFMDQAELRSARSPSLKETEVETEEEEASLVLPPRREGESKIRKEGEGGQAKK